MIRAIMAFSRETGCIDNRSGGRRRLGGGGRLLLLTSALVSSACAPWQRTSDRFGNSPALRQEAVALCRAARQSETNMPPREFVTDGCSLWPDGDWLACCVRHDMAYWCGGTAEQRSLADAELNACVTELGHPVVGSMMRLGTRLGGAHWLPTPFRWGYGWPWLAPEARLPSARRSPEKAPTAP